MQALVDATNVIAVDDNSNALFILRITTLAALQQLRSQCYCTQLSLWYNPILLSALTHPIGGRHRHEQHNGISTSLRRPQKRGESLTIRTCTKVLEDGVELSSGYHRHVITAGQDYSGEARRSCKLLR
jgi:hypothetical protein